jgi:uncharacterized protein YndB with AHSA1/START domain
MPPTQVFANSIVIDASATTVERCLTELELMHLWLNPALRCEPVGPWNTQVGGRSRFTIKIALLELTLKSIVVEREPGLIVWEFTGFFQGRDRWECQLTDGGTKLVNRFEFTIPNPLVSWGFNLIAARWTRRDMQAQLRRLKRVAEEIYLQP